MRKLNLKKLRTLMQDALEKPDRKGVLQGDYVTLNDVPLEVPRGFDLSFTILGEQGQGMVLVCMQFVSENEMNVIAKDL